MVFKTRNLVWGSFWLALGVLLPQIFHIVGGPGLGKVFVPMHLPVLFCGFTLGPLMGVIVGGLSPLLSHFLTGMPPMSPPMVPLMIFELSAYGFFAGLFYVTLKRNILISLISSMVLGRIVLGLGVAFIAPLFGFTPSPLLYLKGAVVAGIPGILMQLVVVPVILSRRVFVDKINTIRR